MDRKRSSAARTLDRKGRRWYWIISPLKSLGTLLDALSDLRSSGCRRRRRVCPLRQRHQSPGAACVCDATGSPLRSGGGGAEPARRDRVPVRRGGGGALCRSRRGSAGNPARCRILVLWKRGTTQRKHGTDKRRVAAWNADDADQLARLAAHVVWLTDRSRAANWFAKNGLVCTIRNWFAEGVANHFRGIRAWCKTVYSRELKWFA